MLKAESERSCYYYYTGVNGAGENFVQLYRVE